LILVHPRFSADVLSHLAIDSSPRADACDRAELEWLAHGVNACDVVTLAAAPLLLVAVLAAPQEGLPFKPMILITLSGGGRC
jgi:hypothetical protein